MNKGKKFLSELKLHSDYLKWQPLLERYETWEEACEDIVDGHRQKYVDKDIEQYLQTALESMKAQDVLASQRSLQYRHAQISKHNMRMFNCTTGHVVRNRVFQEIFYLLLCGAGFGGSVLIPFFKNLSPIQSRTKGTKTFVIPDTIEGWADALGVLMSSYFVDNQPFPEYAGYEIKFDYSQIREKGAYISGGFKAPGHEGLKTSLELIEKVIDKWLITEGNEIRPILGTDIVCIASEAVLSGGVRRSALDFVVDPYDDEMIMAKTGNWRTEHPYRARSNNSVLLIRGQVEKDFFQKLVDLNVGDNDIGFAFADSWFDIFNPCFEISFTPIDYEGDLTKIHYDDLKEFSRINQENFGIQGCNLTEINAEHATTEAKFLKQCESATILGTLQAGYTSFPYLTQASENLFKREALLGVSITGWLNNPKLLNPELLRKGVEVVRATNILIANLIGINAAARLTCVKPSGNASVVLGTASGCHPEHARWYFRIMQLNKEADTAKYLNEYMSFLLEESVNSATNSDYVVYVPIINPKNGLYKDEMKGVKHLEIIKLIQEHWVLPGTNPELGISPKINHNTSCTVIIDDKQAVVDYIWEHRDIFTAVSFMSDFGDREYNQAPFTTVYDMDEIIAKYGDGSLLASGLIVDGLHYFNGNLWKACELVQKRELPLVGTREQVLLQEYWIQRAKKFAKNYFKGDLNTMIHCLKDVHLFHKWKTINRQMKEVDFSKILTKPEFKNVNEYAAVACSGPNGSCEITRI